MEEKVLSYEHFPPRSAFNKNTKFYLLSTDEYFEKFVNYINGEKPKKKPRQGGLEIIAYAKNVIIFQVINTLMIMSILLRFAMD